MPKKDALLAPLVGRAVSEYGLVHSVVACEPEFADTMEFCEQYGFSLNEGANTIIVEGKSNPSRFAACVILATTKLDVNKKICQLLEVKRASFARMDDATRFSKMEFGGITAVGLPEEMPLYIDSEVLKRKRVVMGGGNRSSKLVLDPRELLKLPNIQTVDGLAHPK